MAQMIFKQLFENSSSTYTYLLGCPDSGEALLIDPVLETVERDLSVLQDVGLTLSATLETHIHADHITGAVKLSALTNCKMAGPAMDELPCRDIGVHEGTAFSVGSLELHPLYTPGHTYAHHAYLMETPVCKMIFSGDCLLIEGCGRTDFQDGDAATLYRSIHDKIFTLPEDTLVYPGHDYVGRAITTVGQEKRRNPRLGKSKTQEEFIVLMNQLELPYPAKMEFAIPGNEQCGKCPDNLPADVARLCELHDQG